MYTDGSYRVYTVQETVDDVTIPYLWWKCPL